MFSMLGDMTDNTPSEQSPYQDNFLPTQPISAQYQPTYQEQPRPLSWEEAFNGFKTLPLRIWKHWPRSMRASLLEK
mgnify:CR=1 FL=1